MRPIRRAGHASFDLFPNIVFYGYRAEAAGLHGFSPADHGFVKKILVLSGRASALVMAIANGADALPLNTKIKELEARQ